MSHSFWMRYIRELTAFLSRDVIHYTSGNLKMKARFALLQSLLEQAGIEPERVHLQWASAAEGDVFRDGVTKMVERIKMIGPNPARGEK